MGPIVGITADIHENRHRLAVSYSNSVLNAGGVPVILPPIFGAEWDYISVCDGFIFSGGDDPIMEHWGITTHQKSTPVSIERQVFELSLLEKLQSKPKIPILGVCLGMQWMGLIAGGTLNQHLPEDVLQIHSDSNHEVDGLIGAGIVHSNHHQAITDAGNLTVVATSDDGLIEAVRCNSRNWYVGVQWHPERTDDEILGQGLFNQLVKATISSKVIHL
ncbi:MAG: gamma-glutamyl-gamma-aminobutyrate hydrolase family protein [Phycisphaerales bacterium]|jgi:putative glutamine amidotransferase|nr:gamma-glutamyl-gamma-aminobutyrate hydrolase family protein [Phycisphaerales bacterium]